MHRVEKGLVIREVPYRDADMMLTILTECHGKISAAARGVRRKSSRMSAAVGFLSYSEFTLYESGGRATLNEAEPVELFFGLRSDLVRLSLASYFAEVLDVAADEEVANPELLRLGLNALYALSACPIDPRVIKAGFELRIAAYAGYAPSIDHCAICAKIPDQYTFCLNDGTVHCDSCSNVGVPVGTSVIQAMRHILSQDLKRIFSFSIGEESIEELAKITEQYLKRHFERDFKTLSFYKSILNS